VLSPCEQAQLFISIRIDSLNCADQTSIQEGQEFFELKPKKMKGKFTAQALLRLITRDTKDAPSKEMALAKLVIVKAIPPEENNTLIAGNL